VEAQPDEGERAEAGRAVGGLTDREALARGLLGACQAADARDLLGEGVQRSCPDGTGDAFAVERERGFEPAGATGAQLPPLPIRVQRRREP
jgi:hypothetical protein